MFTTDQRTAKIDRIAACPPALRAAVDDLTDEQLDTPYRDGGWTVRQVVHHLVDSHANAFLRFRWVLSEDHTTIKTYDQDIWATLPDMKMPIAPSLTVLDGLHERWAYLLHAVSEESWSRKGTHPDHGEITLEDLLEIYSKHGDDHIRQITDLRERRGW